MFCGNCIVEYMIYMKLILLVNPFISDNNKSVNKTTVCHWLCKWQIRSHHYKDVQNLSKNWSSIIFSFYLSLIKSQLRSISLTVFKPPTVNGMAITYIHGQCRRGQSSDCIHREYMSEIFLRDNVKAAANLQQTWHPSLTFIW